MKKKSYTLNMATGANDDIESKNGRQEREFPSVKTSLKSFLEYTTAHGCGRLAAARTNYWRVIWVAFCICAHVLFWYHFIIIVHGYMLKPIRTKVSMQRNRVLDFPVVTICNRNMLRRSTISKEMASMLVNMRNKTSSHWEKTERRDSDLLHLIQNQHHSMKHIVSKIHQNDLHKMGHQFKDMVLDCMFDGEDCRDDNKATWRHLWLEAVGNCYAFNRVLPGEGTVSHRTMLTGDAHGLRILINLEQNEYLDGISPYAGLKVVIGPQGKMPFPLSDGISVGPGLATSIELIMKQSSRLDRFHNKSCESSEKLDSSNMFYKYNMSYSKEACRLSCLAKMEINRCQCSLLDFTGRTDVRFCMLTNTTVDACIDGVHADFIKGACDDHCPPQCLDTEFTRTVSSYKWPSNHFKSGFSKSLNRLANLSMTTEEISDNLLELHIYYSDMDYVLVEETLKYAFEDLISNIGGQMGMWIGLSALTIGEVIELIYILIRSCLHKDKLIGAAPSN